MEGEEGEVGGYPDIVGLKFREVKAVSRGRDWGGQEMEDEVEKEIEFEYLNSGLKRFILQGLLTTSNRRAS